MSTSETESESELVLPTENLSSLAAFVQLAARQSQDDAAQRPISWAIETLATLDFRLVRKDTTLHPGIQNCVTTILGFFDSLLHRDLAYITSATLISDIASLFKPSFLHLLFQYRRLFYAIAMRDLHPGSASPAVVCWVDVVLAKLGDVAAFVAAGLHYDLSDEEFPSVLKDKIQEDDLSAATQLPDNWDMVPSMLTSERVSTAAKRLSLKLILARYILHPALSGNVIDRGIQKLLSTFSEFVRQTVQRQEDSGSIESGPGVPYLIQQERFTCAMAISLLAAAEMVEDADSSITPENTFRPHTTAAAMQLLQFILHGNEKYPRTEYLVPLAHLDAATSAIIRWGVVPQWTWSVWSEYRGLQADTIASLTTTYIQHHRLGSGTSLTAGDLDLAGVNSRSQGTAIGFMIELIFRVSLLLSTSAHPSHLPTTLVDVLHEICGFVAQWMHLNACGIQRSTECCKALIILFCCLSRTEQWASLKDRVLESLALTRPQCMRDAWEAAGGDTKFRVFGALDQAFGLIKQILSQGDPPRCGETSAAQLMQFLLVLMSRGITPPSLEVIVTFMEIVWERVLGTDPHDSSFLRETFLACLAASNCFVSGFEFHKFADAETVWQAGICGGSENLFIACAFALYVCSTPPKVEPLTYLECLEHMVDTTLLICSRHYLCDNEPLGLIILPVVCDALLHLLEHEDDTVGVHIGSNGRLAVLGDVLRSLLAEEGPTNDGYQAMLRKRLSASPFRVARLLSETGVDDEKVATKSSLELEKGGYELLFYRSGTDGLSHLMLVPERLDKQ